MIRRLMHSVVSMRSSTSRIGGLMEALQAEIKDVTNPRHSSLYKISVGDKVGDFTLEYQWNQFEPNVDRDVFLRRKWTRSSSLETTKVEEEVAISAVLGPFVRLEDSCDFSPGNVYMKVGVKKTGADSVMLFDCEVMDNDGEPSSFVVRRVSLMPSPIISPHNSFPAGTRRQLQRKNEGSLQLRFKDYLIARGIDTRLTDFLLHHLRQKEEEQYAAWLSKYMQTLKVMS
ncbi:hypothetical protein ZOSMA_89G00020 [Zostera marina]|uniref:Mitochondrial glycoprotein family protein n=1 Tax=Zostera marina TaxID=29655 RepID=A0A0K9NLT2_ZOSMR|nr:hypothetical protein ZOSMA_89G00020 [Zostera marina]